MCFFGSLQEQTKKNINGINEIHSSSPVVEGKKQTFFFFLNMIHPQTYQGLSLRKDEKTAFKPKEFQEVYQNSKKTRR